MWLGAWWITLGFPVLMMAPRVAIAARWWGVMRAPIPDPAQAVDSHRSLILGLAGFSLAALAIVATADSANRYSAAIPSLLLSFLLFYASLGAQAWKRYWWQDQLADGLRDAANAALMLFVCIFANRLGAWLGWRRALTLTLMAGPIAAVLLETAMQSRRAWAAFRDMSSAAVNAEKKRRAR